jgi:hypothetical protein
MELGELGRPPVGTRELSKMLVSLVQSPPLVLELVVYLSGDLHLLSSGWRSSAGFAQECGTAFEELKGA